MEITLNDKDMERLATIVAEKMKQKVIDAAICDESFKVVADKARGYCENYITQGNITFEAKDIFRDALLANGRKMLGEIMQEAVRSVIGNEKELAKTARAMIAGHAIASANELAERLNIED